MGQAKRRREQAARAASLPKEAIAKAVREAVLDTAKAAGVDDGLCALHAAVGQRLLHDRFKLDVSIVAGDLQRAINAKVVHTYAQGGARINAAAGACHVWLVDAASKALIDFSAWEEPKRYASSGCPQGPWTAPRPDYYWTAPGEGCDGIVKVVPDRAATGHVLGRLQRGAAALFVATAVMKAMEYMDLLIP